MEGSVKYILRRNTMSNETKIQEILKKRGLDVSAVSDFADEVVPDPSPRFTRLIDLYYQMKTSYMNF